MPLPIGTELNKQPYGPLARFATSDILPPSSVYVAVDDTVILRVFSPDTAGQMMVDLRMLNVEGVVIPTHVELDITPSGVTEQLLQVINTEGFLLSASVTTFNVLQRGAVFVQLAIRRGRDVVGILNGNTLVQGYVCDSDWLTYPAHNSEPSRSGRGKMESISLSPGGPGADGQAAPAPGTTWIIRSAAVVLVTDATVINRTPGLVVLGPAGNIFRAVAPAVVGAGLGVNLSYAPGATLGNLGNIMTVGLPADLEINDACQVLTATVNLQAGDLITGALWVETFVGRSG